MSYGRYTGRTVAPLSINSASNAGGITPPPTINATGGCGDAGSDDSALVLAGRDKLALALAFVGVGVVSVMAWMTKAAARGSAAPARGHCAPPQWQANCSAPTAMAPNAAARRWPSVRGSAAHTPAIIAAMRLSSSSASTADNRPHNDAVPVSSSGLPSRTSQSSADS